MLTCCNVIYFSTTLHGVRHGVSPGLILHGVRSLIVESVHYNHLDNVLQRHIRLHRFYDKLKETSRDWTRQTSYYYIKLMCERSIQAWNPFSVKDGFLEVGVIVQRATKFKCFPIVRRYFWIWQRGSQEWFQPTPTSYRRVRQILCG